MYKYFFIVLSRKFKKLQLFQLRPRYMRTNILHRFLLIFTALTIFIATEARGNVYEEYIAKYSGLACKHEKMFGIPASITLAQGLLESGAGRSKLAREGNNHFGIKCHSDWHGKSMILSDDRPDDCFRVYDNVEKSFEDHSQFLRRKRYASLFDLDPKDYAGWARGLKRCGYATDPQYADRLISIIELYSLYNFDSGGAARLQEMRETADFIHKTLMSRHIIRKSRGLHYVIAQPGDTYALIAKELNINKKKLLSYNDVKQDGEIKPWQEVYLQEKLDDAPEGERYVTIGEGESIHSIAQRFGMKLKALRALNPDAADSPGTRLKLF